MIKSQGTWKDVIYLISLLVGNDYIIRNIKIKEYNSCQIEDNNREWSIEDGEVLLLGKSEDISSIPNNKVYNICDLRKKLHRLHDNNASFIIGNDFYYPYGIELSYDKLEIPTDMNNVIYYGNREDYLGVVTKVVYNYILWNGIEVDNEDIKYLNKRKLKKIC